MLENIEIHLLALRDAADLALKEIDSMKANTPQANQKKFDKVEKHLSKLNSNNWGKRKKN